MAKAKKKAVETKKDEIAEVETGECPFLSGLSTITYAIGKGRAWARVRSPGPSGSAGSATATASASARMRNELKSVVNLWLSSTAMCSWSCL